MTHEGIVGRSIDRKETIAIAIGREEGQKTRRKVKEGGMTGIGDLQ